MRTRLRFVPAVFLVFGPLAVLLGLDAAPAAAGGGACSRDRRLGPTEATGTTVDLVDFCMSASVLRVEPAAVVTFTNRDPAPHNVVGSGMYVDELATGESVAFRFDHAGTFAYACTLHPGMVGAIAVGDGRRAAPATTPTAPVEVSAPTTLPTSLAAMPLGDTSPVATDEDSNDAFPIVAMMLGVFVVVLAAVGYRVVASTSPWRTTNHPSSSPDHERNPSASSSSSSVVANP